MQYLLKHGGTQYLFFFFLPLFLFLIDWFVLISADQGLGYKGYYATNNMKTSGAAMRHDAKHLSHTFKVPKTSKLNRGYALLEEVSIVHNYVHYKPH